MTSLAQQSTSKHIQTNTAIETEHVLYTHIKDIKEEETSETHIIVVWSGFVSNTTGSSHLLNWLSACSLNLILQKGQNQYTQLI